MEYFKEASKNINLYDVKAYVRKAQNVAMNLSEMESKVREATNNEPWGASTTLMAQIAAGTYNYREREEILSFIFRRFTEKSANEWRQIYKSLQLLDYLIRNGLERIIDDVRANTSLIQMLKLFHYIDSKGRDQGVNVRNRLKNLLALLNDDALIRLERKKARANAKKFGGVLSAAYGGALSVAPADGFGGDDDFTGRVYGDGGVFGARYDDPASEYDNGASGVDTYEEYDETAHGQATTALSKVHATRDKVQPQAPTEPEIPDLLGDFGNASAGTGNASTAPAATGAPAGSADADDDDFDDFQTAPLSSANLSANLANLYVSNPGRVQQPYAPSAVNTYGPTSTLSGFSGLGSTSLSGMGSPSFSGSTSTSVSGSGSAGGSAAKLDAFSSLFSSAKTRATPAKTDSFSGFASNTSTQTSINTPSTNNAANNATNTTNNSNTNSTTQSGEIDLLSF